MERERPARNAWPPSHATNPNAILSEAEGSPAF